ncbi:hypothetical protein H6P81_004932 [Aristolochia fimbriata]|uniref:YTH domain-containing family protein n=1 Tax=Aristolochia fimbriata TaxID=158543 RepID=A0AAV7EXJ2_ARIFI|nr:hypothetical protein H6P81_004932 [Aristolochia fimbriata]
MATSAAASDQAADILEKPPLDSKPKTVEIPQTSTGTFGFLDVASNLQIPGCERTPTPLLGDFVDPNMCYLPNGYTPYYYGGYDGPMNEWEDYPRYVSTDGMEMSPQGAYGDTGSLMYHGYGYAPYGPYSPAGSPVPTMGHDGQLYGPYQYQTPYYSPCALNQAPNGQGEVSTSVAADQVPIPVDTSNKNTNGIPITNGSNDGATPITNVNVSNNGATSIRPNFHKSLSKSNGSYGRGVLPSGIPPAGYQDPGFGYEGIRSPIPWSDGPVFSDGKPRPTPPSTSPQFSSISPSTNHNHRPVPHLMGLHPPRPTSGMVSMSGFINRMYPNRRIYGGNAVTSQCYGSIGCGSRSSGRGWSSIEAKYKSRGNLDGLKELNRGPRARIRNQKGFGPHVPVTLKVPLQGQGLSSSGNPEDSTLALERNDYNRADFPIEYADAVFFVIKSYSEDDIHKSIKYSVWASTPSGNKKLDAAYQEAQQKSGDCPVFLFFSVNTSGQFVGLAEMVSPVDFAKNLEYWQQDKWNGCFSVKWHIVKDVPNSLLKHIILDNNDNKPVTNSRDCQQVNFDLGLQMLKIFKEYSSRSCIFDDFAFYESRQKTIQDRKSKHLELHKQGWDGKRCDGAKEIKNDVSAGAKEIKNDVSNGVKEIKNDVSNGAKEIKNDVSNGVKESNGSCNGF